MPQSIPNDPSLQLGSVVPQKKMELLVQLSDEQAKIDAVEDALNSQIQLKRSMDMTIQELINMGIDTSEEIKSLDEIKKSITETANNYGKISVQTLPNIVQLKGQIGMVSEHIESPVDFNKSQIKLMPLSYDSFKMNAQYFSYDKNDQSASNNMSSIKSFLSESLDVLGFKEKSQVANAAQQQISNQRQNHDIEGTLVITAVCTNKDSAILAPFILDVDKAVRAWNFTMPKEKKIKVDDVQNMMAIAAEEGTDDELAMNILSAVTYGSSFVGMVHVLRTESVQTNQAMMSIAESMQASMEVGGWFAKESGGFGVDASFANDVKNLLSKQNITSHVSLVSVGAIPNIKSNTVKVGVREFSNFDAKSMMGQLAVLQNATAGEKDTVEKSAADARTGGQLSVMQSTKIQGVMTGLAEIDYEQNKMLDINSLMTALEDYVDKALAGNIGVPLSYSIKPITRAQLAQMWVNKYYPGRYLSISGDDSAPNVQGTNQESDSSGEEQ